MAQSVLVPDSASSTLSLLANQMRKERAKRTGSTIPYSPRVRELVGWAYSQGVSVDEIARHSGIHKATIYKMRSPGKKPPLRQLQIEPAVPPPSTLEFLFPTGVILRIPPERVDHALLSLLCGGGAP